MDAESALRDWMCGFTADENTVSLPMEVFLRNSMLLGVVHAPVLRPSYLSKGVFFVGSMSLRVDAVYDSGGLCDGKRADQILVSAFDPQKMERLSLAQVLDQPRQ